MRCKNPAKSRELIRLRHKFTAAGRTMELICEQKMLEKNRKMQYKVVEGMKLEGTWVFKPTERGTKLTNTLEYQAAGWMFGIVLDKLKIKKEMARICSEGLEMLKKVLETGK